MCIRDRYNWNTGYGGAELGLSYPITKHVRLYTQVYSGYGESLIDYNFCLLYTSFSTRGSACWRATPAK